MAKRCRGTRRPVAYLVALFVAMLAAATADVAVVRAADEPVSVGVDAVRSEPLLQTQPVIGRLVALRRGVVAVREPGIVAELRVDVGDRVQKGEVIAVLVTDRLAADLSLRRAEVGEANAAVAAAEAERQLRRQELARIEGLRRSPAFSEGRFEDARQQVAISEGRLAQAEAALVRARSELSLAEIALRDASVLAPYSGVVTQKSTEVGAHLSVGEPVVTMIDDQGLEIEADVPAERVAALVPGRSVDVRVGDRRTQARVRAMVPDENPLTRTRTIRFVPEQAFPPAERIANRSVVLDIPVDAPRAAPTVHKDAVLHSADGTYVIRIVDGRAERRVVRIGEASGSRFEVIDGLVPGDLVVIRGNERLEPGQRVRQARGSTG